jgi:lipopolysaccharide transport system permease protein
MAWRYVEAREAGQPLLRRLFGIWHHRRLLRRMAERDLHQRYAGTSLGYAWAILYPLLLVAFYAFIFTVVFRGRLSPDAPPSEYALYVVSGLLPWVAFSEVATRSTQAMAEHRGLVKFAVFPIQILPLTSLYATAFSQVAGLVALLAWAIWSHGGPSAGLLWLIPVIVVQIAFLAGISWLLGALGAVIRDVKELVAVALMVGMFLTPIFYVERDLPAPLRAAVLLNPLTHLLRGYRDAVVTGAPEHPLSLLILAAVALVTLLAGFRVFERTRVFLADIL